MTALRIGNFEDDRVSWLGKADILYFDRLNFQIWAWLPSAQPGNYVGLGSPEPIELGPVHREAGNMIRVRLDSEQFMVAEEKLGNEPLLWLDPLPFEANDLDRLSLQGISVSAYLGVAQPSTQTLRCVAWWAARCHKIVERNGLEQWLAGVSWNEIATGVRSGNDVMIRRDAHLFTTLKQTIESRRLVLILGGIESGLTQFLDQFKEQLASLNPVAKQFTADFDIDRFNEMHEYLEQQQKDRRLEGLDPISPDTGAIFASLAYTAYQNIVDAPDTDSSGLSKFIRSSAATQPNVFMQKYLGELSAGGTQYSSEVEFFLTFLCRLIDAADHENTITVLLSFPRLFQWLTTKLDVRTASRIVRHLWSDLKAFNRANYDSETGAPKAGAQVSNLTPKVGILVELRQLPLEDVATGFCKGSVLTLPPFSESEVQRMWKAKIGMPAQPETFSVLRKQTAGHPWLLAFLLDCIALKMANHPAGSSDVYHESLEQGVQLAERLLSGTIPEGMPVNRLMDDIHPYLDTLARVLDHAVLSDRSERGMVGRGKPLDLIMKPAFGKWFESGLVWPTSTATGLLGFGQFPMCTVQQSGVLSDVLISRLMRVQETK
jgi:hypothetical protein